METVIIILKGILIGFIVNVIIGAVGILCIQRALHRGWHSGFVSGMGAAFADFFAAAVSCFGLMFIHISILRLGWWLRLAGGVILIYLGVKSFIRKTPAGEIKNSKILLLSDFGSTFILTLANPMTYIVFAAIFVGFSLITPSYASNAFLVAGVFVGAVINWILLIGTADIFRRNFSEKSIKLVNKIGSVIIILFGLAALVGSLGSFFWENYRYKIRIPFFASFFKQLS